MVTASVIQSNQSLRKNQSHSGPQLVATECSNKGSLGLREVTKGEIKEKDTGVEAIWEIATTDASEAYQLLERGSLLDWLLFAAQEQIEATEQYTACVDRFQSELFVFARLCRAHHSLRELPDYEVVKVIERVLVKGDYMAAAKIIKHLEGYQRFDPMKPWSDLFSFEDEEEARSLFCDAWNSVRVIPFLNSVANATRLARERPIRPPHDRGKKYAQFVSIAYWMQCNTAKPILLPVEKLARHMGCTPQTVSRLRRFALQDGLLQIVEGHSFKDHRATRFRFVGNLD